MKRSFRYWHEVVLAALLVGLLTWAGIVEPQFVRLPSQVELSTHMWELALLAMPMTLIIITAGIDLSVGSTLALCAVVLGLTYERGVPPVIGAAMAVMTGLAAGALNGVFVAKVKVHPLIVTLATLAAFRGIAEGISQGRPMSGFPDSFAVIGRGSCLGLPIPALFVLAAAGIAGLVLMKTPTGRFLYAIGHNETATRFSGILVDRIKLWLYSLSGGSAGLAAVILVARRNTAKADLGAGMELDVITAVVLGGTSIFGGRGNILGTVLGVLLIHETREFVSWHWNRDELNLVVIGIVLIASVLLHQVFSRKSSRLDAMG
ncbi:MAG TPA: ABC transporter permease [Verrucomicrobiae bacterium]|nr:ABC transporter permease [Verrucomicrobiae bacterium]